MLQFSSAYSPVIPEDDSGSEQKNVGEARNFVIPTVTSTLRVLVVDDELLIRWSMTETLAQSGCTVSEAADGASALQALAIQPPPDVVLLDFRLPDSNDLALLARIRQRVPTAAIVMMTAFGSPEMTRDAEGLGAYKVIGKPIDMRDLDTMVRAASAAHHGSRG